MSNQTTPGLLVVLSAPSGCGKTTLVDGLLKRHPDWVRSISATTRTPREGEKTGKDYFFISEDGFLEMREKGDFLEYARVFNRYYGTPKSFVLEHLKQNRLVLLAIDVQGATSIRKIVKDSFPLLSIFILPPSMEVLRERLEGRKTETPEQIDKRIETAKVEVQEAGSYDVTVVNQNLEATISEIERIIEKKQTERNGDDNVIRFT